MITAGWKFTFTGNRWPLITNREEESDLLLTEVDDAFLSCFSCSNYVHTMHTAVLEHAEACGCTNNNIVRQF